MWRKKLPESPFLEPLSDKIRYAAWQDLDKLAREAFARYQPILPKEITERQPITRDLTSLEQLGEKFKPSKRNHDYLRRYAQHFEPIRLSVRSFVEIGVETSRSILLTTLLS